MSGFFGNYNQDPMAQRQALISKYNAARLNLVAVVIFSAINIITLIANTGVYMLFSANMPYVLTFFGLFVCGMLPEAAYKDPSQMVFFDKSFFVFLLVISILILLVYLACWWLSKDGKVRWLKIALGLFMLDSISLLVLGSAGMLILDIAFHAWIIYILISGIKAYSKIKALPKESEPIEAEFTEICSDEDVENTEALIEEGLQNIEAPSEGNPTHGENIE